MSATACSLRVASTCVFIDGDGEGSVLDGGLSLLGVGGWELRDDLDVDLVVSLGILRAARREGGKDSRKAKQTS